MKHKHPQAYKMSAGVFVSVFVFRQSRIFFRPADSAEKKKKKYFTFVSVAMRP